MICHSCTAAADLRKRPRRQAPIGEFRRIEVANLHALCTNPPTCTCQHRIAPVDPEPGEPQP